MRRALVIVFALCALTLSGCDQQKLMNAFIPKDEAATGQQYLEDIRTRNFQPVVDKIDPAYKTAAIPALEEMASIFPRGNPKNIKVVGSNTISSPEKTMYNLTYEYEFPHSWILGHIYFGKKGNDIQIERMDVNPLKDSLEHYYAVRFDNKPPLQYAILTLAILLPIFTIISAIACFRTPIPKRKWLWVIFVLVGIGSISLNWTTGELGFNPLSFALFGAMYTQQFYGPAIIQIAVPLGAIIFWFRRSEWIALARSKVAAAQGADVRLNEQ